jgi:DNA polymerase I-like protein with 3'-5' exonuclease and polymerase domains
MTLEEMKALPPEEQEAIYQKVHKIRKPFKTVNYAAQYSVGKKTLARNSGMTEKEAQALLDTYWQKNWAVQKVAKEQYVKTLKDGTMWLKNPINGFYYSLRYDKDRFSTLVQGTGDYVFNLWTMFCRKEGIVLHMNYHDEWLTSVFEGSQDQVHKKAQKAMDKVNEVLQLNKEIRMDAQEGYSYAECH